MSVKAEQLPDLIAAAVKKAVAEKYVTNEQLATFLHRPITIGIFPVDQLKEALVRPPTHPIGFVLDGLSALHDPEAIKAVE